MKKILTVLTVVIFCFAATSSFAIDKNKKKSKKKVNNKTIKSVADTNTTLKAEEKTKAKVKYYRDIKTSNK